MGILKFIGDINLLHPLRKALAISFAVAVFLSAIVATYRYYNAEKPWYEATYQSVLPVAGLGTDILAGKCHEMPAKLTVYENSAILSVGSDNLSGIPVNMSANGVLTIQLSNGDYIYLQPIVPQGYEKLKDNAVMIVVAPTFTILLSNDKTCQTASALVEQTKEARR